MKMNVFRQFRIIFATSLLSICVLTAETALAQTATIAVQSTPLSGGTVSGGGQYDRGTNVTVCATPNPGYEFVDWSGTAAPICSAGQACPECYTVTADMNYNLVANFAPTNTPPIVTTTYVFTNAPLWDVSGSYTNTIVTNDVVIAAIQQLAGGRIIGIRTETAVAGADHRQSSGSIEGRVVIKAGAVSANLRSRGNIIGIKNGTAYSGNFATQETLALVPSASMILETGSIRSCLGGRCRTSPEGGVFPLPHGLTGSWTLTLDTAKQRNKLSGAATITLSNGRALDYVVHGTSNPLNGFARLHLVGAGAAAGTWLNIKTQGPEMLLVALQGHVLSQRLTVP